MQPIGTTLALLCTTAAIGAVWLHTQTDEAPLRSALDVLGLIAAMAAVARAVALVRRTALRPRAAGVMSTVGIVGIVALGCWIGANSPQLTWFGSQVSHGPRDRQQVALTFDDGPNATATLAIAAILDAHNAKGTFFTVGKAVNRRPDITRALIADGHLIGNHSYHHDSTHWLDPRYLELGKAQDAIGDQTGVCPAFFRAPHGQHTPFMAHVVHAHGMVMAGWDVSAGDWLSRDPQALARQIVSKARPGSIIDLHDGLDGNVDVDRTVLVRAMPYILDGLAARHLEPVRLDVLLNRPGYLARCDRRLVQTRAAASGIAPKSIAASVRLVRER